MECRCLSRCSFRIPTKTWKEQIAQERRCCRPAGAILSIQILPTTIVIPHTTYATQNTGDAELHQRLSLEKTAKEQRARNEWSTPYEKYLVLSSDCGARDSLGGKRREKGKNDRRWSSLNKSNKTPGTHSLDMTYFSYRGLTNQSLPRLLAPSAAPANLALPKGASADAAQPPQRSIQHAGPNQERAKLKEQLRV